MRFLVLILVLFSCSNPQKDAQSVAIEEVSLGVTLEEKYPKRLSDWNLFEGRLADLQPGMGVYEYDINSPLFTDYAFKKRFIKLPEGEGMIYHPTEVFAYPEGTILVKNFYYPSSFKKPEENLKILETRLLIKEKSGWKAIVYVWNDEQTDAERKILGEKIPVEWQSENGLLQRVNYRVPSQPQCKSCHELNGKMTPIGPSARQLNVHGQLENWAELGLVQLPADGIPKLVDYRNENESIDLRARAWLEINCAHCHRKEGPAKNTGLYLLASQKDDYKIGINKPPIAAGRGSAGLKYGIVPGHPEQSILVHRIETLEPGEMMPELGRTIQHTEGIDLIKDWISRMNR